MTKPFNIESVHINRLSDIELTQLLSELLQAEAYKFGLAQSAVEVALNIRVGDGGEDGRISWSDGPVCTDYIPNRLTMFQNKATEMSAADYANEIITKATKKSPSVIKPKVDEVLSRGGAYIIFTTQELNTQQKNDRVSAVRDKLREYNKVYADSSQILIYESAQISRWVNNFVSTIVSVQHWNGTPLERGLKTFSLWEKHEELSRIPFVSVNSRSYILDSLSEKIKEVKSCFRITGLSGLGKTRTAFQIFNGNESLKSLVVYADANQLPNIDALVADWVSLGLKCIIVVDNCDYRLHERLGREVRRQDSHISLLTLDYNFETVSNLSVCFRLEPMTNEELMMLLTPIYQDQLSDLDRIVAFAQGFPQMAVLLAQARLSEDPKIGELTEDDLANKLLGRLGEKGSDSLKIIQACSLFDVFGIENEAEELKWSN
ncbi:hypothetical protein [Cellvibrio sp. PSBB006]|uniref:hypothetical protein n=1 Tax=Cellvibrio sp. PSBB006 TaxID=1987723 RepID=UPI000B3B0D98|nr:hypothetical protein [Cellvibrio sp. PSBB006]ARU27055.1 hypothetical protein CBR65_06150 [Cellvibrio sp. PSBB006]